MRESVVANFATTAADGKTYQVDYYNLDVIISVGYRVKSKRGTQFRIKEFMGLTTFVGNQPTLKEAVVTKNYLSEKELTAVSDRK